VFRSDSTESRSALPPIEVLAELPALVPVQRKVLAAD
jgi:hypothetical protein